jgi:AraC family transcriptional regulator, regulatory protein of adaptative response / methylated-DNA-[protein]-cysteine methyltransferase
MTTSAPIEMDQRDDASVGASTGRGTLDDDAAWAAVTARDGRLDGRFVYAVATTGVYCRPGCGSRRPLRANVAFFATPDAAEAAGFRPCRRCHPRDTATAAETVVARARAHLDAHADEPVTLDVLARVAGMSPYHLQRTFKRLVGVSPKRYAAALRAERLKAELRGGATVSRATFDAGYGASSRAYHAADVHLGMSPAAYRRGGRGTHIRYATTASAVGRVLVAATERGVCAVTLGDDDAQLERALAAEFPNATRERVDVGEGPDGDAADGPRGELREWLQAVAEHLDGTGGRLAVPVDAGGTAFQQRVWSALREIPYGETRSYSELAAAVGAPRAVRAVASACAHNRVALVIPCHRVVRQGGALGGYRWGVERKRRLLAREHAIAAHRVREDQPAPAPVRSLAAGA